MQDRGGYDYTLLFAIIFIACFGLVMVYSSSSYVAYTQFGSSFYFFKRQAFFMLLGIAAMFVVSKIDYHLWLKFAVLGILSAIVLMLLVNFTPFGIEFNGKKRWFGIAGHSLFQAAEYVKIVLIIGLAAYVNRVGKRVDKWPTIVITALISIPLCLLVAMNNLSTGIILVGITFVMVYIASQKKVLYIILVVLAVVGGVSAVFLGDQFVKMGILKPYQFERIYVWLDPEAYALEGGHQVIQGLYAIGSGGLFGKGLGKSLQKLGFVPEARNDMIFSIICEELGVIGALALIAMFMFVIYRLFRAAINAPDLVGAMITIGVMTHIAIQVILNVAVVTNTIPNTGVTLPFISYGGTSVIFLFLEIGLALSVSNLSRCKR
ncbi:MAG: cell division protein FtsW [Lachnospiraceae bacterium]|nr:cell division protein FtsW [Lachnospiraceae bacterium]